MQSSPRSPLASGRRRWISRGDPMRFIDMTKYTRYGLVMGILTSALWIGCGVETGAGAAGEGDTAVEAPGEDSEAFISLCGGAGKPCCGPGQCNVGLFCIG